MTISIFTILMVATTIGTLYYHSKLLAEEIIKHVRNNINSYRKESIYRTIMSTDKNKTTLEEQTVFCYWCGEEFELKPYFAEEHMKRFPWHIAYRQEPKNNFIIHNKKHGNS